MIRREGRHQITGTDLDVSCECGWYNHDPDESVDKSATAHVLREVVQDSAAADKYEADLRAWMPT